LHVSDKAAGCGVQLYQIRTTGATDYAARYWALAAIGSFLLYFINPLPICHRYVALIAPSRSVQV
jgi:hypothetical protein